LWLRIEPNLFAFRPKKLTGRKLAKRRKTLNTIILRMRSGCQYDQLPGRCGPKSTVHDWFQRWAKAGIVERIWAIQAAVCDELGGVQWEWQSADATLGKAQFGGAKTGKNPSNRSEKGTKKSLMTHGAGGPLDAVTAGASVVEQKRLEAANNAMVIDRPEPMADEPQHLCFDKGYDNPRAEKAATDAACTPRIRRIGKEKEDSLQISRRS